MREARTARRRNGRRPRRVASIALAVALVVSFFAAPCVLAHAAIDAAERCACVMTCCPTTPADETDDAAGATHALPVHADRTAVPMTCCAPADSPLDTPPVPSDPARPADTDRAAVAPPTPVVVVVGTVPSDDRRAGDPRVALPTTDELFTLHAAFLI